MSGTHLSTSELAQAADVNVETVRYYERRGLLPEPPRTPAGYRTYDREALARLQLVTRAKRLGFTLREIRELLVASDGGSVDDVVRAARAKLGEIDTRLAELARQQCRLRQLVETCETGDASGCISLEVAQPGD
jgi:DNA-binding transcriptional MerR regulator